METREEQKDHPGADTARLEKLGELTAVLRRIMRTLYYRANATAAFFEMPILQVRCLNAIAECEGQRMVDVAARANVGLPGVSRTVDRLVKKGLVLRETDPSDRRAVQLRLTEASRSLLRDVEASRLEVIGRATARIDCTTLQAALDSLTLLANESEAALADDRGTHDVADSPASDRSVPRRRVATRRSTRLDS